MKKWLYILLFFSSSAFAQLPYQVQLFDVIGSGHYLPNGTYGYYLGMSVSGDSIGWYAVDIHDSVKNYVLLKDSNVYKKGYSSLLGLHDTANKMFRQIDSNQYKNAITLTYGLAHFKDTAIAVSTGLSIARSSVITLTNTKPDTGISVSTGLSINRALNQRTLTNTKPDTAIIGGTDISISRTLNANTINFTGSLTNDTVLKAGNGISIARAASITITNTLPDTAIVSGNGISISRTASKNTITNSLPDTAIVSGNGISIARTGSKNTITNSLPDTALVVSTGLSIARTSSKNTLTNTKPDTGISVSTGLSISRTLNQNTLTNTKPDTGLSVSTGLSINRTLNQNTLTNTKPDTGLSVSTGLSINRTLNQNTLTNTKPDTGLGQGSGITITRSLNQNTISANNNGTVTSVSNGNLSPLFTSSVANSTTTPSITYTAVSEAKQLFYGGGTANQGTAAPTFRSIYCLDLPATVDSTCTLTIPAALFSASSVTTTQSAHTATATLSLASQAVRKIFVSGTTNNGSVTPTFRNLFTSDLPAAVDSSITLTVPTNLFSSSSLSFTKNTNVATGTLTAATEAKQLFYAGGTKNQSTAAPTWRALYWNDFANAGDSAFTNGTNISVTGTGNATIALTGTVAVANGGTGATTAAAKNALMGGTANQGTVAYKFRPIYGNDINGTNLDTAIHAGTGITITGTQSVTIAVTTPNWTTKTYTTTPTYTSTTTQALGLGYAFTPAQSGYVELTITGNVTNGTAADGTQFQICYGTGSAPNAHATTGLGTTAGSLYKVTSVVGASDNQTFCATALVSGLTISTAYWLDLQGSSITGGTSTFSNITTTIKEAP